MKLFSRVCMFFVSLSCAISSIAMAESYKENDQIITISTNAEAPKKSSLFVRCVRPPLRTIKTMTGELSYILGSITILGCINLFTRGAFTAKESEIFKVIVSAWLANKAIYHLSDYALEEMN